MTTQYLPPLATLTIHRDGIIFNGRRYQHPNLSNHIGEEAMIFNSAQHGLEVCIGTELICIATICPTIQ